MRTDMVILSILLPACSGKSDDSGSDEADTDTDTDTDADTDADSDADTDTDTDTDVPLVDPFADVSARLHDTYTAMFIVSWTQDETTDWTRVEYSVDKGEWRSSPDRVGSKGAHEQIVIGAPYGHDVTWRVVGGRGEQVASTKDQVITTGGLPVDLPLPEVDLGDPRAWEPGADFLLTSVSDDDLQTRAANMWISVLDRQGRYVWVQESPRGVWTLFVRPTRDGTAILWDEPYYWTWRDNDLSEVHRQRLDGTAEHSWSTPYLHHSFDELSADTIIWNGIGNPTDVVYTSTGDDDPVPLWDCWSWLEGAGLDEGRWGEYCGANALAWHEASDTVVLSLFSHEMVVALDATTTEVRWYSEPDRALGLVASDGWEWQHDTHLLSADRLMLFTGVDGPGPGGVTASAAYEYAIDTKAGTLDLVWSAVSDDWISAYKGGALRLASGNTLVNYGDFGAVREIAPDGTVVWSINFGTTPGPGARAHWVGRSTLLTDLYPFVE